MKSQKIILTILCAVWFVILCFTSQSGSAKNTLGGGIIYQQGFPFVLVSARIENLGADFRFGITGYFTSRNGDMERVSAASAIGSLKLYIPFRFPVNPYLEIGGIATTVQLSQLFGDSNASTASSLGVLFSIGAEYEIPWFPVDIFASLNLSTIAKLKLVIESGSQSSIYEVPVRGISGFSWSVGLRYEFLIF